jgi:lipopolysaccharide export system permease protein
MIFSKIWERMLLFRAIKFILFFLLCIYFVYVTIDLSAHSGRLFASPSSVYTVFLYYLHHFLAKADLFLPLSMLLATISLLCTMNLHHEIVSLRMAGVSHNKLTRPLFLLALFLSSLSYLNYEYLSPTSLQFIENFKENFLHHSKKSLSVKTAPLIDGSKIVYQIYDAQKQELFDLFWIRSHGDIWYIKTLCLNCLEGRYVDHLVRNEKSGLFEKKESFINRSFPEISFASKQTQTLFLPKENLSISSLYNQKTYLSKSDRASTQSHLYYKLALPLLSPLIVLALSPFCTRFSRNLQIFFLTALSLFGFFTFITLMDGCVILGENQVVSPLFALWLPPLLLFVASSWHFLTTKH